MTKRLAIQLFGHLRTFEYTFEKFKENVLNINQQDGWEIDIFIHTWNELDHSTVNYRNPNGVALTDKNLLESDIEKAKELYQPKEFLIEQQRQIDETIIYEKIGQFKRSIKGCYNMAYTLYKSSELRRNYAKNNNITYDWVIVTRPDILFKEIFRIDDFFEKYNYYNFDIPKEGLFYAFNPFGRENKIDEPRFITGADLIYFANPKNVDKATSLYENFDKNLDINNFYCMEVWWHNYWKEQGLLPYPILYRHGPEFDMIKTCQINIEQKEPQEAPKAKYTWSKIYILGIPLIKVKTYPHKIKYLILNFIPILKIKLYPNKSKFYLFNFIYFMKEKK